MRKHASARKETHTVHLCGTHEYEWMQSCCFETVRFLVFCFYYYLFLFVGRGEGSTNAPKSKRNVRNEMESVTSYVNIWGWHVSDRQIKVWISNDGMKRPWSAHLLRLFGMCLAGGDCRWRGNISLAEWRRTHFFMFYTELKHYHCIKHLMLCYYYIVTIVIVCWTTSLLILIELPHVMKCWINLNSCINNILKL